MDRYKKNRMDLAHELWAGAQLAPGEGIADGVARIETLLRRAIHSAITHCNKCGCSWLDDGLNPIGCPYCEKIDWRAVNAELLPPPPGEASSFGNYEVHNNEVMAAYARANIARAIAPLQAEIERLQAEVERLSRYYKNGIDCFANPCERHSGERTPPFAEFFEKYGGQCLICVVDNNKALQAENERLAEFEAEDGKQ